MAGNPNLDIAPKFRARVARVSIVLAEMHTVSLKALCQGNTIIDHERDVMTLADRLERLGQPCSFVLLDILDPKLECRDEALARRERGRELVIKS